MAKPSSCKRKERDRFPPSSSRLLLPFPSLVCTNKLKAPFSQQKKTAHDFARSVSLTARTNAFYISGSNE
jgi:hypothetical protein